MVWPIHGRTRPRCGHLRLRLAGRFNNSNEISREDFWGQGCSVLDEVRARPTNLETVKLATAITACRAGLLGEGQIQIADGFVDFPWCSCSRLLTQSTPAFLKANSLRPWRSSRLNVPSPTSFMLITPMPSLRTCWTCVTTSGTLPRPSVL